MKIIFVLVLITWANNSPSVTRVAAYDNLHNCQTQAAAVNDELDHQKGSPTTIIKSGDVYRPAKCIPANL